MCDRWLQQNRRKTQIIYIIFLCNTNDSMSLAVTGSLQVQ
jgi:hypothetical protein